MTVRAGAAVLLLVSCVLVAAAHAAAADAHPAHRKLQQGRPWGGNSGNSGNQGNKGQGQGQGNNRPQGRPSNKGDRSSLSKLNQNALAQANRPKKTIAPPSSGPANSAFKTLKTPGNSKAAAKVLTETYNTNSQAAAEALSSAATDGGSTRAVAEAMAQTTAAAPNVAPGLISKSANIAVENGQTQAFGATMAESFGVAKRDNFVPDFTRSVSGAMQQGGASTTLVVGEAMAQAIAQGGDSKAAVAEATAQAFCEGGSTAQSWAAAYAVTLSKDSNGCLVLNEAKALAQAKCGAGTAESTTQSEAGSLLLGFCGLIDFLPIDFSFGSTQSGGQAWAGQNGWPGQAWAGGQGTAYGH